MQFSASLSMIKKDLHYPLRRQRQMCIRDSDNGDADDDADDDDDDDDEKDAARHTFLPRNTLYLSKMRKLYYTYAFTAAHSFTNSFNRSAQV